MEVTRETVVGFVDAGVVDSAVVSNGQASRGSPMPCTRRGGRANCTVIKIMDLALSRHRFAARSTVQSRRALLDHVFLPERKPSTFTIPSLNIERVYYRYTLEKYAVHCNSTRADCTSPLAKVDFGKSPSFGRDCIKSLAMSNTGMSDQGVLFRGEEEKRQWAQMLNQSRILR